MRIFHRCSNRRLCRTYDSIFWCVIVAVTILAAMIVAAVIELRPLHAQPQLVVQSGHRDVIYQVAKSPDGQHLATVGGGEVKVWDLNGTVVWSAAAGGDPRAVAWSPTGASVAVGIGGVPGMFVFEGGDSAGVQVRDARDGTLQKTLLHRNNAPDAIGYAPDGRLQAFFGGEMVAWDKDGHEVKATPLPGPLLSSPDHSSNAIVVSGGIQLWNAKGTQYTGSLWLRHVPIGRAAWSPHRKRLATFDGMTLRVWDTRSRRCIRQIPVSNPHELRARTSQSQRPSFTSDLSTISSAIVWSADAQTIVVATTWWPDAHETQYEGYLQGAPRVFVRKVSWPRGTVSTITAPRRGAIFDMHFVGQNRLVTAGVTLAADGAIIGMLSSTRAPDFQGHSGWTAAGYTEPIIDLALSPDGHTLAAASGDTSVRLWDWQRGILQGTLKRLSGAIVAVAWSPDGHRLVEMDTHTIAIWDVAKRHVVRTWKGVDVYTGEGNRAAWSPDATTVVVGSEGGGKICNVQTGTCREPAPPTDLSVTDDKSRLFGPFIWGKSGLWETTYRTDPQSLRIQQALRGRGAGSQPAHDGNVGSFDLYDNEKHMVTVGGDDDFKPLTVKIWDVDRDVVEQTLENLPLSPHIVKASPDGQTCVLGSREGDIALVSLKTFKVVWTRLIDSAVTDLAWSRDGQTLFVAGLDGRITILAADGAMRASLLKLPQRPLLRPSQRIMDKAGQDWIVWTPRNHYTGSPDAEQHIRWRDGKRLYAGKAFASQRRKVLNLP